MFQADCASVCELLPCCYDIHVPVHAVMHTRRCQANQFSPWQPAAPELLSGGSIWVSPPFSSGPNAPTWYTDGAVLRSPESTDVLPVGPGASVSDGQAPLRCYSCPDGLDCLGGALTVAESGSWHSDPRSAAAHKCANLEACRDGDEDAQAALAVCKTAWYATSPPGINPAIMPGSSPYAGKRCVLWHTPWSSLWEGSDTLALNISAAGPGTLNSTPSGLDYNMRRGRRLMGLITPHQFTSYFKQRPVVENSTISYVDAQCAEGYVGLLCGACTPGYYQSSSFECNQCLHSPGWNALVAAFFVLLNLVFLW